MARKKERNYGGRPRVPSPMVTVGVRMPSSVKAAVVALAARERRSLSAQLSLMVEDSLARRTPAALQQAAE